MFIFAIRVAWQSKQPVTDYAQLRERGDLCALYNGGRDIALYESSKCESGYCRVGKRSKVIGGKR